MPAPAPSVPRIALGSTGLLVPRLCVGTGTSGHDCESRQSRQGVEAFARVLRAGHARGASFWDTSDNYGTHPHVRAAMAGVPRHELVITTKSYARTAAEVRESLGASLEELGTPYVDILLLHEVDSPEEFEKSAEALVELHRLKAEGLVRAVGLSTHAILTLEAVAGAPLVDVILTNFNLGNLHMDADTRDYQRAMAAAAAAGQGVIAMKTLAEGRLADRATECIAYNLSFPFIHSVVVGVVDEDELETAIDVVCEHHRQLA